jgi:ABC-type multidrug transport system fused ATPase/permease subunit
MNSVERLKHYIEAVEHEAPEMIEATAPSPEWPQAGHIRIENLVMGYRDGPNILHAISATIKPGEKIGVVGRTGSGKSTLLLAMFRLLEAREGRIVIDDVDIATIGLKQLRSRLGIIPQDPVLFVGSLRYNLDPFDQCTDAQLWAVLECVQMQAFVEGQADKLLEEVQENGSNFSVGQRQLVCIARALLLNPQVLMLDEATASIDSETDAVLQNMIRHQFQKQTVISIAHRLDTIIDYDRIMVMDAGNLAEFDSPMNLLEKEDGIFSSMINSREGGCGHLRGLASAAAEAKKAAAIKVDEE